VLTYGLPGGRELVLDATHRLSTILLHGLDARILALSIRGPLDPRICADLAFCT
jgi:hypothetical protein